MSISSQFSQAQAARKGPDALASMGYTAHTISSTRLNQPISREGHELMDLTFHVELPGLVNVNLDSSSGSDVYSAITNSRAVFNDGGSAVMESLSGASILSMPYYSRNIAHMMMGPGLTYRLTVGSGQAYVETCAAKNMLFNELFRSCAAECYGEEYGHPGMTVAQLKDASSSILVIEVPVWCCLNVPVGPSSISGARIHFHDFQLEVNGNEAASQYTCAIHNGTGFANSGDLDATTTHIAHPIDGSGTATIGSMNSATLAALDTIDTGDFVMSSSVVFRQLIAHWKLLDQGLAQQRAQEAALLPVYEPFAIFQDKTVSNLSTEETVSFQGYGDITMLHAAVISKNSFTGSYFNVQDSEGESRTRIATRVSTHIANQSNYLKDNFDNKLCLQPNNGQIWDDKYGIKSNRFSKADLKVKAVGVPQVDTTDDLSLVVYGVRGQLHKYDQGVLCKGLSQGSALQGPIA